MFNIFFICRELVGVIIIRLWYDKCFGAMPFCSVEIARGFWGI